MNLQKERPRGLHQIALVALFTLGNSLLRFPWASAEAGVTVSFLLSVVAALLFGAGSFFAARRIFRCRLAERGAAKKIFFALFAMPVCALSLFLAAGAGKDLVAFFGRALLSDGAAIPFAALYFAVAAWLACIPRRGMDVFAMVAFFAAVLAVTLLFLCGIPQFRTAHGKVELPELSAIAASVKPVFSEIALPMFVLGVYLALAKPKREKRGASQPLVFGILVGGGITLLCVLQTLLTFGADYAATLQYPYSAAVRVVSVGAYAFRPELLSYLPDFSACLVRIAVAFSCLKLLFGKLMPRRRNFVPPIAALSVFLYLYLS